MPTPPAAPSPAQMSLPTLLEWTHRGHPLPWHVRDGIATLANTWTGIVIEDATGGPVAFFEWGDYLLARVIVEGVNALRAENGNGT